MSWSCSIGSIGCPGATWPNVGAVPYGGSSNIPQRELTPEELDRLAQERRKREAEERELHRALAEQLEKAQLQQDEVDDELQEFEDRICRVIEPGSGIGFKDAPDAPEMVVVPRGELMAKQRAGLFRRSRLYSKCKFDTDLAISRYAITFDEWDIANCSNYRPSDSGWGRGRRPVINVSWRDAENYLAWLRAKTGRAYRLLSEDEWEYACRAGALAPFWWGRFLTRRHANFKGNIWQVWRNKSGQRPGTVPVDDFQPNPWGLYQMHGNVWEWCKASFGVGVRGGSFASTAKDLRDDTRWKHSGRQAWDVQLGFCRTNAIGFRVCRELGKVTRTRLSYPRPILRYPEPIIGLKANEPHEQEQSQ